MAIIKTLVCADVTVPDGAVISDCPSVSQYWLDVQLADNTFLQEALYTIDTEVVAAIFGGTLLLFVTGMGAGWLVNAIKMAR